MTRFRRQPRGFTLVELLIVIAIISVLIVLLVVGVNVNPVDVRTKKVMESIEQALVSYVGTYGAYPPSDDSSVGSGSQCLYYYMMGPRGEGWGPDKADGGIPVSYKWGPAKELDQDAWTFELDGKKFFTDGVARSENALLYYRANTKRLKGNIRPVKYSDIYDPSDNKKHWKPDAADWKALIVNKDSLDEAPYNPRTYLLIGPGNDGEFGNVEGKCDDILNAKRVN